MSKLSINLEMNLEQVSLHPVGVSSRFITLPSETLGIHSVMSQKFWVLFGLLVIVVMVVKTVMD